MEPNTIEFRESRKEILTIHADGRITVSEDCKPTETAAEVLRIMRDQWLSDIQCAKIRELQERIEALNRGNAAAERILCELTGCESGRDVPDWIVAAKNRIKRLEEAGDEMWKWRDVISAQKWEQARREAKP